MTMSNTTNDNITQTPAGSPAAPGSDTPATDAKQAAMRLDQPQAYEAWEFARELERAGRDLSDALEAMAVQVPAAEDHATLTPLQYTYWPALKALNRWQKLCPNG